MKLETLTRPLAYIDIEATGLDLCRDRIVSLAALKLSPADLLGPAREEEFQWYFHPGFPMTEEVIGVHGITNAFLADKPAFADRAGEVLAALRGCDLAGFNLRNFDIPLLWEEFHRGGIDWSLEGTRVLDAGVIFKKKESRTLSAALKFYCGAEHDEAHDAAGDCRATRRVLEAQLEHYSDLSPLGPAELDRFSDMAEEGRVDLAGTIALKNGIPVYTLKRVKDVPVEDDPGFARWMLKNDFTENTKMHLRRILNAAPEWEG